MTFDPVALVNSSQRRLPAEAADVACGTCTVCCRRELVLLTHNDNPLLYETKPVRHPFTGEPAHLIPHKADGTCIYLGEAGCTIYDRRPEMCRAFTCVGWVSRIIEATSRAERRDLKAGLIDRETWDAGVARLPSADAHDDGAAA